MSRSLRILLVGVLLIGLVAAFAVPAAADRDDPLLAGRANGAKGYMTSLYSTNPTATLTLVNNRAAGAPALSLQVKSGPALKVNTTAQIPNLNASLLQGRNLSRVLPTAAACSNDAIPADTDWQCTAPISTPAGGGQAHMMGSVYVKNTGSTDWFSCWIEIDGTQQTQSYRRVTVEAGGYGTCAANYLVGTTVGGHTYKFVTSGLSGYDLDAKRGAFQVMVIPSP